MKHLLAQRNVLLADPPYDEAEGRGEHYYCACGDRYGSARGLTFHVTSCPRVLPGVSAWASAVCSAVWPDGR